MVGSVSVDERRAFFVDLTAGEQEGEAGGEGEMSVDFVAEFAREGEEGGRHSWKEDGTVAELVLVFGNLHEESLVNDFSVGQIQI